MVVSAPPPMNLCEISVFHAVCSVKFCEIHVALCKFHQHARQISRHPWQRNTERDYHSAPQQDSCSEVVCFGSLDLNRQRCDGQRCEHPLFLMEGLEKLSLQCERCEKRMYRNMCSKSLNFRRLGGLSYGVNAHLATSEIS